MGLFDVCNISGLGGEAAVECNIVRINAEIRPHQGNRDIGQGPWS